MIAWYALFSSWSTCEDATHTGATYYVIEWHRVGAIILIVPAFVPILG